MSLHFKLTEQVFELADVMSALDRGITSIQHVASSFLAILGYPPRGMRDDKTGKRTKKVEMLTRQEAAVCNRTTSMLLTFKPKSLKEVLLHYFSFLFRCQNNIREFGKHGGFSFRSLKIQRAVDTNTRLM